jgi:hypothetical protein
VETGRHAIRVELDGYAPAERIIEGRGGEEVQADFGLVPAAVSARRPSSSAPAADPPSSGKNPWLIGAGAVAGTATLAVGIGYGVAAMTSNSNVEQHNINAGVLGAIGGGILAATLTYALWPSSTPAPRTGLTGAPVVLNNGGGLTVNGAF